MPLDKMPNPEEYVPTHKSIVLHVKGKPAACIVDENPETQSRYASLSNDPTLKVSLVGFLNKDDELGLFLGFKLKIKTDAEFSEYTVYPNEEFVDTLISDESVYIINEKLENLCSLRMIVTDQFVKTKSEFDKFQKMMT